jgi:hypothetical protein
MAGLSHGALHTRREANAVCLRQVPHRGLVLALRCRADAGTRFSDRVD